MILRKRRKKTGRNRDWLASNSTLMVLFEANQSDALIWCFGYFLVGVLPFQTPSPARPGLQRRHNPLRPLHLQSLGLQQNVGSSPTAVTRSKSWVWLRCSIVTDSSNHSNPHKWAPQNGMCFDPPAIGAIIAFSGYQPLGKATVPFSNTLYQVPEINSSFKIYRLVSGFLSGPRVVMDHLI